MALGRGGHTFKKNFNILWRMYVHIIVCSHSLLTYFHIKIFVHVKLKND